MNERPVARLGALGTINGQVKVVFCSIHEVRTMLTYTDKNSKIMEFV